METIKCKNFEYLCYVCGEYTPKKPKAKQRMMETNISAVDSYKVKYKNLPIITNSTYAPTFFCEKCSSALCDRAIHRNLPDMPMVWLPPNDDHTNCYACMLPDLSEMRLKRYKLEYPVYPTSSAKRPVLSLPRDRSPLPVAVSAQISSQSSQSSQSSHEEYHPQSSNEPKRNPPMSQAQFNDHCRDLKLGVNDSELEGSRLRESGALEQTVKSVLYRVESVEWYSKFANKKVVLKIKKSNKNNDQESDDQEENEPAEVGKEYIVTYLKDLAGMFSLFELPHITDDWRLFLDGSSNSLKAVLIHNDNLRPSVPLAYVEKMPETYESMEKILKLIEYNKYEWWIIVDFKLVNILSGHMAASCKYPCIYCEFEPRSDDPYKKDWEKRSPYNPSTPASERHSATKKPLVPKEKILLPPLHIKIGLVTQLCKKLYKNNTTYQAEIPNIIKEVSTAKHKGGVYNGPQIRTLFSKSRQLKQILTADEYHAFNCLKIVCESFLGNYRHPNYKQFIENLMESYKNLDISVTIKMHSLISHLDKFKDCGKFSDEQGERFHQDIMGIEKDYKGKDMVKGLGRYCWSLIRESDPQAHKRQSSYDKKMKYFQVTNKYLSK